MRYAVLAGALAFVLCSGICYAEDAEAGNGTEAGAVAVVAEDESGSAAAGSDVGCHIDTEEGVEEPVDRVGVMSPGQSYDENTGLPDVVESDSSMDM
ncbi:MAG: hypothetical protein V1682_07470 [Candidatus Omnitrophota bacterium]